MTRLEQLATTFAIVFPTILTYVYFVALQSEASSIQQTAYSIGKLIQFGFPVAFVFFLNRKFFVGRLREETSSTSMWIGIGFGIAVVAAMFLVYFLFLKSSPVGELLQSKVMEKTIGVGIDSWPKFLGLGIFYSLCHSFLEEYYWRWFVFGYLERQFSTWTSNLISSIGFMAHHVILLGVFLGWNSPLTYLFSFGVGIGGVVWAWLYDRSGRLRAPWISHLIVDAGIFSLGYFLVRESLIR